ncbi:MAG TPA: hypothetical protein PKH23_00350 [Bacillota bacterium]|nr:hypothetical protein [Bacillota bacterium]
MGQWAIKTSADYKKFMSSMKQKFKVLEKEMLTSSTNAIYGCLADTLEKSVPRAPVEEGSLRESGHVSVNGVRYMRGNKDGSVSEITTFDPTPDATEVEFEIGYSVEGGGSGREGDVNAYAIVQHEHTEFNHPKGGESKFLESAVDEDRPTWKKRIAEEMKNAVRNVK